MPSKALTISFLVSGAVHLTLLAALKVTGFQVTPASNAAEPSISTIVALASVPAVPAAAELQPALPPSPSSLVSEADAVPTPPVALPATSSAQPIIEPAEVKLGIDDGHEDSQNWIGFKDPTEFRAPKSTVDQAEVSLNPGQPSVASGAPGKPGEAGKPGEPGKAGPSTPPVPTTSALNAPKAEQAPSPTTPPVKGDAAHAQEPQAKVEAAHTTLGKPDEVAAALTTFDRPAPAAEKGVEQAKPQDQGNDNNSRQPVEERQEKSQGSPSGSAASSEQTPIAPSTSPAAATPAPTAVNQANQATQGNQGQRGSDGNNASSANITGDKPGEKDDREADASAVIDSIDVVPGKPAAAKGLRIQTSRPQWSMATKLTARPRNPVIRITFGPTGRVVTAEFEKGKSTGYPDVDQPLLNAIYRWTARGETIDKLNPANPRAGVTITVNILLN
ncbi:MAG: hypothetical protein KGS45_02820 [Planctomycetes bacterium]|nr:hypothetical protein [Planctomycetota bacterium]